jgi:nucleoid-associated protein YgaU
MALKDFFRKGKEEKVEPKQPGTFQQQGQQRTGSMVDLENKNTSASGQNDPTAIAPQYYEIKKGDTLSAIAKREYGDAAKWRTIYEANKDQIKNPDLIHPGQKIKIPSQSK